MASWRVFQHGAPFWDPVILRRDRSGSRKRSTILTRQVGGLLKTLEELCGVQILFRSGKLNTLWRPHVTYLKPKVSIYDAVAHAALTSRTETQKLPDVAARGNDTRPIPTMGPGGVPEFPCPRDCLGFRLAPSTATTKQFSRQRQGPT